MTLEDVMPGLIEGMRRLLDIVYPPRCVVCGRAGDVVCVRCLDSMHPPDAPICAHCGTTISAAMHPSPQTSSQICPECAAGRRLPHLEGVRVATTYAGAARAALLALKFGGQRRVAERLAILMVAPFQCDIHMADMVIPVPLHHTRQRERGYNQAALLARAFVRI
ncbi:MAG TPA: double zinc ribbon domain-containing protein, partial [Ktedonobacterales bacterium]|nr:double zinc ribbon domain-containing protein [Ktedonobacterales bacterium]